MLLLVLLLSLPDALYAVFCHRDAASQQRSKVIAKVARTTTHKVHAIACCLGDWLRGLHWRDTTVTHWPTSRHLYEFRARPSGTERSGVDAQACHACRRTD